jgi:hypothetical protein
MQTKTINGKRLIGLGIKIVLSSLLVSTLAFGALLVNTVTEKRQAVGEVTLELCQGDGHGNWKVIDRVRAPLNFEISLADASSRKEVNINHVWNGRSEQGCQGSVSWERATDLHWDEKSGKLELITPYVLTLNGHTIRIPISCTTESLTTPLGPLTGQRAVVSGGTLSAGIVGFANFKAPRKLFQCSDREKKNVNESEDNFIVVFRGQGKATVE